MIGRLIRLPILFRSIIVRYRSGGFKLNGLRVHKGCSLYGLGSMLLGKEVTIGRDCIINCSCSSAGKSLVIGDGTYIGRLAQINAYKSVTIEGKVLISDRVYISDATHNHSSQDAPIMEQGTRYVDSVHIKEGGWIGIGVCIMPGVTVGKNAIIGANSVVTHDVDDYAIVAGVPARPIKSNKSH